MAIANYLKETQAELRHVTWPSRQQTINFTAVVIGFSVLVGIVLSGADLLFTWLLELFI